MNERVTKECIKHGLTDFFKDSTGRFRCMKCRVEAVQKRRNIIKQKAVEYKGESVVSVAIISTLEL